MVEMLLNAQKVFLLLLSSCLIICIKLTFQIGKVHDKIIFDDVERTLRNSRKELSVSSATFVTAMYDIKRDQWPTFKRTFNEYLDYFENVIKLELNLILFCEPSTLDILKQRYKHHMGTNIYPIPVPFDRIEFQKYHRNVNNTLQSEEFQKDNMFWKNKFPEAISADYIILMGNKVSFMKRAIELDPFKSSHFFWIDAGYGHGNKSVFPPDHVKWTPARLLKLHNVVTYIQLVPNPSVYKKMQYTLHKSWVPPAINGGFFGGTKHAVLIYYFLFRSKFIELFNRNIVDDDQNIAIACYFQRPDLFYLVRGGWGDVFKLFG